MSDCIFCKLAAGEVPTDKVWEGEHTFGFRDTSPQAPTHIQIIPKRHVERIADFRSADDSEWLSELFTAVTSLARSEGLDGGFRLVVNNGALAGQSVLHVHVHLLGGRPLTWPPG